MSCAILNPTSHHPANSEYFLIEHDSPNHGPTNWPNIHFYLKSKSIKTK